ncbi:MAG: rhomboid family intramembrane serine protease [Acidimicrobiia bacterium]
MLPLRDRNPTRRTAVLTLVLIALNVGVYALVQPSQTDLEATARFSFERAAIPCELTTGNPLTVPEVVGTANGFGDQLCDAAPDAPELFPDKVVALSPVSSMFLHGGLVHLGGNMLYLWIFGNNVEDRLGRVRYLFFYLAAGLVATAAHVLIQPDSTVPLIGASGAIAGVMGAYLVWFPRAPILSWILVFIASVPARWLLLYWFVSQFFINPNEGVAWGAHVGGFAFGVLAGLLLRRSRPAAPAWG